jgi:hypothetical protein
MEQRCHLGMVWLTWLGLPLLAIVLWIRMGLAAGLVVLLAGVVGQVLYVRWFPHTSRWLGYGIAHVRGRLASSTVVTGTSRPSARFALAH